MIQRYAQKLVQWFKIVDAIASEMCTCKVHREAAVVATTDLCSMTGMGYAGPQRGAPNDSCGGFDDGSKRCRCPRSVFNALTKAGTSRHDEVLLLCTRQPTAEEARYVVNSRRIVGVVFRDPVTIGAGARSLTEDHLTNVYRVLSRGGVPVVMLAEIIRVVRGEDLTEPAMRPVIETIEDWANSGRGIPFGSTARCPE